MSTHYNYSNMTDNMTNTTDRIIDIVGSEYAPAVEMLENTDPGAFYALSDMIDDDCLDKRSLRDVMQLTLLAADIENQY